MLLDNITSGLINSLSLINILWMNIGLFCGIIFGSLPGLTATMGVALFLPVTFGMEPIPAMFLLLGIYCGGIYGGSITAILIKTPGTPAAAATVIDGNEMARLGHPGLALDTALKASTFGGLFSALILIFAAPQLAKAVLNFTSVEKFMLSLFGLSIITTISGKQVFKGLIAACIGMLAATVGLDPIEGLPRFVFNINEIQSGIDIVPALIGLFAITEILNKVYIGDQPVGDVVVPKEHMGFKHFKSCFKDILKSSVIGTIIGAIPGTGGGTAAFLSYIEAKRSSKTPEKFGTGYINGVAAPEAGNNGVTGATLIPLLTLGIPGDSVTAVMLGALTMQGLIPGPALFTRQADMMYTIMVGLLVVNIFMLLQGKVLIKAFIHITKVPSTLLSAILIVLCVVGGFSVNNNSFDAYVMMVFALIGYVMYRFQLPGVPLLLGLILGPMAEENLRRSLVVSKGSWSIFFTRPISLVFFLITVGVIVVPIAMNLYRTVKSNKGSEKDAPVHDDGLPKDI